MRMKLSAEGRKAPPPILDAPFHELSQTIQTWSDIIAATHWHLSRNGQVDGADFYRGDLELGHIHLQGDVHLVTSPALTKALVAQQIVQPFPYAGAKDWCTFRIQSSHDLHRAEWLFRLGYDYLGNVSEEQLLARVLMAQRVPKNVAHVR